MTLGLCSQRELDALVAKAAKAAGIEAPVDDRLEGDREALIGELRAQREAAHHAAEAVHAEAGLISASAHPCWTRRAASRAC